MKLKLKSILHSMMIICCTAKSYGQACDCNAANAVELRDCLDDINNTTVCITADINLDPLIILNELPLNIHQGVTLMGFVTGSNTFPNWWDSNCPLIESSYRKAYDPINKGSMFLFKMQPSAYSTGDPPQPPSVPAQITTIQNLRIQGASWHWQEDNNGASPTGSDGLYSGGIMIERPCTGGTNNCQTTTCSSCIGYYFQIRNCEIYGFSYAGIYTSNYTNEIAIENCYLHHVKGQVESPGIGYEVWTQGSNHESTVTMSQVIFDDGKEPVDGQAYPVSWNINECTISPFFKGGISRHNGNNTDVFNHQGLTSSSLCSSSGCSFYSGGSPQDACSTFAINQWAAGNTNVENSIFYLSMRGGNDENGVLGLPYPWWPGTGSTTSTPYHISITNNTFTVPGGPTQSYANNKGGYAQVAYNYIESCPWSEDLQIRVEDNNGHPNTFEYEPGQAVLTSCPQPPEFRLELTHGNSPLPKNGNGIAYLVPSVSNQFTIATSLTGTGLGSQNPFYIIRPNTNRHGLSMPTGTWSNVTVIGNNHFFDDQKITVINPSPIPYEYLDTTGNQALPGLYGVDVMAIASDQGANWAQNHASSWKHKPLIVVPATVTEPELIFNIKDSYHDFLCPSMNCTTGVLKQARLNNQVIWNEDIAQGGDDWERVGIPWGNIEPYLTINGPNKLSFDLVIETGFGCVDTDAVKGIAVWVDDVYLNKYGAADGESLIEDGTMESCTKLSGQPDVCPWYFENERTLCTVPVIATDEEEYYPDNSKLQSAGGLKFYDSKATDAWQERKSGSRSLVLMLPDVSNGMYIVSIKTEKEFLTKKFVKE